MKITILRRSPGISYSMDVYADALVDGLKTVRPNWIIEEDFPRNPIQRNRTNSLVRGVQKYYQRYWQYPKQVLASQTDVYHIIDHSDGYLVTDLRKTQIPVVVTCHDIINLIHPELFQDQARFPSLSMTMWKLSLKSMRKANRIVTVSSCTAQDVVNCLSLPANKIKVVPNGVDAIFQPLESTTRKKLREVTGCPEEVFCLLNVGSNNPRKNIITILRSLLSLRNQRFPIHFCKVGDDFTEEQKKFITQHQLEPNVTYLGKPDKAALVNIYNAVDLLVAPSTYEGFGITILEAMACGLPVVTSNTTSLPEVAGDAAILVDPLDVVKICKVVRRIYTDQKARQILINKGLERSKQFSWESTAEQIAQVYESVLTTNHQIPAIQTFGSAT